MTVRVEMHSARSIRYGAGARNLCEQIGRRIAREANAELSQGRNRPLVAGTNVERKEFVMDSRPGRPKPHGRWRVTVTAVGAHARRHNAIHQTLLRLVS